MITLLFINRPNDKYNKGTGISSTFFWLKNKLNSNNYKILECKKIFNIYPFRSILSILTYDYLNPIFTAFKYKKEKINYLIFIDPAQCFFIYFIKKILNRPKTVVIIHDLFFLDYNDIYHIYIKLLYNISLKYADYIITTSDENKKLLLKNYPDIKKITVLPWGLTINTQLKISKKLDIKSSLNQNIIGYIGSSLPRKRIDRLVNYIIKSIENNEKIFLLLAGPISKFYIDKFINIKNSNFNFNYLGLISEKDKVKFFNTIDVFFFPTELEGFGLPILESFYFKKPCIIYNTARIPEFLKKYCWKCEDTLEGIKTINKKIYQFKKKDDNLLNDINNNYYYAKSFKWDNYINYFNN